MNNNMNGTSGSSTFNGRHQSMSDPILVLEPVNDTFAPKALELPEQTRVKIGRQTGVTTAPHPSNGYFDSKVLSRVHAEVWSEGAKVFIRDLKSSNGTFLNGRRLCPENTESEPFELNQNDSLEFGIDIMDENGALLHEKVSCKIYISRMSYPTPGSSPQDSHAKIKPTSPVGSGINSVKTNNSVSANGGQSENIDLIISRLQNELTRSQETYADLGFLKHSLGELEKAMIVSSGNENGTNSNGIDKMAMSAAAHANGRPASAPSASLAEYEKLLEQKDKEHAAEILKMVAEFDDAKAVLETQRTHELRVYREENETLRRTQEKANEALTQAASKMDFIMARISAMIQEHKQEMEVVQKDHETALVALEAKQKEDINRLVLEADAEQEGLTRKHKRELAQALAQYASQTQTQTEAQAVTTEDAHAVVAGDKDDTKTGVDIRAKDIATAAAALEMETEMATLMEEVQTLRQAGLVESRKVEALTKENGDLVLQLDEIKAELRKTRLEMKASGAGDLETLTPTLRKAGHSSALGAPAVTAAVATGAVGLNGRTTTTQGDSAQDERAVTNSSKAFDPFTSAVSASTSTSAHVPVPVEEDAKNEFSWAQFVFPMGKKNQSGLNQPSTMLLSGGFMLVGLGVYALWHKVGMTAN